MISGTVWNTRRINNDPQNRSHAIIIYEMVKLGEKRGVRVFIITNNITCLLYDIYCNNFRLKKKKKLALDCIPQLMNLTCKKRGSTTTAFNYAITSLN